MREIAKKFLCLVLICAMFPVFPVLADESEENDLRLWYTYPSSKGENILSSGVSSDEDNIWQQHTLPIGNGDIGANVYGEIKCERLTFNEKTLWTGGPSKDRADYNGGNLVEKGKNGKTIKEIQRLFKEEQTAAAQKLCDELVGTWEGYGAYQAWGEILFDNKNIDEEKIEDYVRDLDLKTAVASVSFKENGTSYRREFFISHPHNVLVIYFKAEGKNKLNFDIKFQSKQGGITEVTDNSTLKLSGQVEDNQLKYSSFLKAVNEGGKITGGTDKLIVENANSVTVFISAATDYKNDYPVYRTGESMAELDKRVLDDVSNAAKENYDDIKREHIKDYESLFGRVKLNLGQVVSKKSTDMLLEEYKKGNLSEEEKRQLEVLLFSYGRYLMISSSRNDSQLPANLQGVWNNRNNPPWASDYHMNVNLQMNYWPVYSTNLTECSLPLIKYVDSLREPGRVTAEIYAGVTSRYGVNNGFMAHTQNTPFGWTCPGWQFNWGWSPAAVPWILQNCWEHYEYTCDIEFMKNNIYPMMKEDALLYDAMLVEDEDGKLVSSPTFSPEHGPRTAGNTYEQSLI